MPKKKKRPLKEEGPPDASLAEINQVLLAGPKRSAAAAAAAKNAPVPASKVVKTALKTKASQASHASPASSKSASKTAPKAVVIDGAKLALDLLEAATTQLLRRKGWFRDVRLRRSADAFMKSSKLHQRATARHWSEEGGAGFAKPSTEELAAFEQDLEKHLVGLRGKLGSVPMNERREISLSAAGPGKVIGAKLKGLRERATELHKKPRSVIKGTVQKKGKAKVKAGKKAAGAEGGGSDGE
eukprot:gb/GFBE01067372.1/.p1 GENE.gb/GFBE01067372.1/~~gb/GFBE01067372.1/.p1  ORF type:complete len:242 (+),score=68.23 gb/GFBE01067372.1/:1-726(+)